MLMAHGAILTTKKKMKTGSMTSTHSLTTLTTTNNDNENKEDWENVLKAFFRNNNDNQNRKTKGEFRMKSLDYK